MQKILWTRMRKKLQEEIKRLEKRLETEALSITEEKTVIKDVKRIKTMRANFAPYQKRYKEANEVQEAVWKQEREAENKQRVIDNWKEDIESLKADLLDISEKEKEVKKIHEEVKKQQESLDQKEKKMKSKN